MQEHDEVLIRQLILKPAATVVLEAGQPLPAAYVQALQAEVTVTTLSYVRPMSLGAHVLGLEPPLGKEAAQALAESLSKRADVDYAEPDTPRLRR